MPAKPKKHPLPARVRPKVGAIRKYVQLLNIAASYLAGQSKAAIGPALAGRAATLKAARDVLVANSTVKTGLLAELDTAETAMVNGYSALVREVRAYANEAATAAGGDPKALADAGVEVAVHGAKGDAGPAAAPIDVKLVAGPTVGSAIASCHREVGCAAYTFQYKLEPSLPTDPWLPPNGASTRYSKHTFDGFAAEQQLRVRICAIGEAPGPWSVEVVGRAK